MDDPMVRSRLGRTNRNATWGLWIPSRSPLLFSLVLLFTFASAVCAQQGSSDPGSNAAARRLLGPPRSTEIHVDENCRIDDIAPHTEGLKQRVYRDDGICHVSGYAVSQREETDLDDAQHRHVTVTVREHTFVLHNPGAETVTFVVEQKVPKGWAVDSDPEPQSVVNGVATFIVTADGGQTVNLHVGERKPPAPNEEPR
jgi:hypothetical protein